MGCQQGKIQTQNNNTTVSTKGGFNRAQTMKNGNGQKQQDDDQDKNESYIDDTKNENGITHEENKHINPKSNTESENENDGKKKKKTDKQKEEQTDQKDNSNPPLKYTFTINGKSLKQIEDEEQYNEQDNFSDVLLSTEIREGNTPQLSDDEIDEYMEKEHIYDKKDITLADIGDGMMFEGGMERKMTLNKAVTLKKAATLKKASTLKKRIEQKQIIHSLDIQPSRDYFMPDFCKQFTRQASQKHFAKTTTLFVPQQH